jgi:hypothetical protein
VPQAVLPNGNKATPRRCISLQPSSSTQPDGCPSYWSKDNVRYNYRQSYATLPTDAGNECNMAGEVEA